MSRTGSISPIEFDGSGGTATSADVLVEGQVIAAVGEVDASEDYRAIDAGGCFVMPGMVEGRAHLSIENVCAAMILADGPDCVDGSKG